MRDDRTRVRWRARDVLFGVCALCTVWLFVQNAVLFALMPWERLPGVLHALGSAFRAVFAVSVPLALLVGTLALAWWRTRPERFPVSNGDRHA